MCVCVGGVCGGWCVCVCVCGVWCVWRVGCVWGVWRVEWVCMGVSVCGVWCVVVRAIASKYLAIAKKKVNCYFNVDDHYQEIVICYFQL